MKRTVKIMILWTALLALVAASSPSSAQIGSSDAAEQRERVERELGRTREILERIAPFILEADLPRARELFEKAVQLQTRARIRLEGTDSLAPEATRGFGQALTLTLQARELGKRAGQLVREQVGLEERARRLLDQATTRLERMSDHGSDDPRFATVLQEARSQLETAYRHFRDQNFEIAVRLAESALKLLEVAPSANDPMHRRDRLELAIRRTHDLLQRAVERSDELSENGRNQLRQAEALLQRARARFENGNLAQADALNKECRRVLREVLSDVRDVGPDQVTGAMEQFDTNLTRLRDELGSTPPQEVEALIERAMQERDRAEQAQAAGDHAGALARLRAALGMLDRARNLAEKR